MILIFAFALLPLTLFAQNPDLKYYRDYSQDFEGYAGSVYFGKLDEIIYDVSSIDEYFEIIKENMGDTLTPVSKLTKNNAWLLKKAMNEWDYEPEEIYLVFISQSYSGKNGILVLAVVDERKSYKWIAFNYDEDGLYELMSR